MFANARKSNGAGRGGGAGLSFIGSDVAVSGDLTSSATIHIDGRIDGNLRCESLVMGETGVIAGNIEADEARIAGLVDGAVRARLLTLEPSARVTGDVTYETLSIAAGAQIEGRLARKDALAAAPAALIGITEQKAAPKPARPAAQAVLPALDGPRIAPAA